MYQFIVATRSSGTFVGAENPNWSGSGATVGGHISTMSLAGNGTNKWASRAVVALQLAAWSAVGIVLLEKGVTSLKKNPQTPVNVSQEITMTVSSNDSLHSQILDNPTKIDRQPQNKLDSLSVIPVDGDESNRPSNGLEEDESTKSSPREVKDGVLSDTEERSGGNAATAVNPRQWIEQTNDEGINDLANKNGQSSGSINSSEKKNSGKKTATLNKVGDKDEERGEGGLEEGEEEEKEESVDGKVHAHAKSWPSPVTIKVIMDNFEEHRWESRKRLRVGRVSSGGGAAAAVAMVAVGAVMLVLGPAVIILRALDERRQERRFLKLSGEEDLPPSYEEATSELDQAPTYSSLNLDSILTTSESSNPNASENSCLQTASSRRGSCCC